MGGIIGFFIGFMSGGIFGLMIMAIIVVGRDEYYYEKKPE